MTPIRTGQAPAPMSRADFHERFKRRFADPSHEVSVEWLDTRQRLKAAQKRWSDSGAPSRVLLVCGSGRNDGTCARAKTRRPGA